MSFYGYYDFKPYVPVAERRRKAAREMQKLRKQGHPVSPVEIEGRAIAKTFWGKAWCDNLERYSDFENRVPRGRTYVRNGSVVDLQIAPGEVKALVSGSEIYRTAVKVSPVPKARWTSICADCAGAIDSLVELLQGHFSGGVMQRICQKGTGLFPAPAEIEFSCSCPDWASMCKHVAAVLYGIGARLDQRPELLFLLRKVDQRDLIAKAGQGLPLSKQAPAQDRLLDSDGLSELFGLEMGASGDDGANGRATGTGGTTRLRGRGKRTERAAVTARVPASTAEAQGEAKRPKRAGGDEKAPGTAPLPAGTRKTQRSAKARAKREKLPTPVRKRGERLAVATTTPAKTGKGAPAAKKNKKPPGATTRRKSNAGSGRLPALKR